ncbi:MAG TPA: hypothetical protein VFB38_07130 [Chthonomonadaceae bacterium]|nr:hypothetical protein [Chthonomonadaceae bacterium]
MDNTVASLHSIAIYDLAHPVGALHQTGNQVAGFHARLPPPVGGNLFRLCP